jgi:hypothetical protein
VLSETTDVQGASTCATCAKARPGFYQRYRGFLAAPGTLITVGNALLLALGFLASLLGEPVVARWLYLVSALVGGAPIFKLAATNILRDFDLTAGVMVSIAMIAALIVGEYSAAALVAFMMLVGEMLEDFTVARADRALDELEQLVPATVTLRHADRDETVPVQAVRQGDRVLVRPGGRVPADGQVREGSAAIDQSAITGESIPIDVALGDRVYAGTLCTSGALEIIVDSVGRQTALGEMIEMVKGARGTQAPVQRVASKYAQYLTPMAIGIAAITYLATRDVTRSITVLIVICPCSLVLATPTALVAAIGNAAHRGVLVKHGPAMEQVGRVDVVAFDKTGTLTLGEPRVQQTLSLNGMQPLELLALAATGAGCERRTTQRAPTGQGHRRCCARCCARCACATWLSVAARARCARYCLWARSGGRHTHVGARGDRPGREGATAGGRTGGWRADRGASGGRRRAGRPGSNRRHRARCLAAVDRRPRWVSTRCTVRCCPKTSWTTSTICRPRGTAWRSSAMASTMRLRWLLPTWASPWAALARQWPWRRPTLSCSATAWSACPT